MIALIHHKKALIAGLILLGLFVWRLPLHTQDGPNHKKVSVILERLADSPVESAVYQSKLGLFRTNTLFPQVYQLVADTMSIDTYEKVFWGFFILLIPLAYYFFLSVWSPQSQMLWILVLPLCFNPLFVRGFYNFLASVPLTILALTLMRQGLKTREWKYWLLFIPCCWLAFIAHPFPLFILSISLLLLWLVEYRDRLFAAATYALPLIIFLVLGFLLPLIHTGQAAVIASYAFRSFAELVIGTFLFNFIAYSIPQLAFLGLFFALLAALAFYSLKTVPWKHKIYWFTFLMVYLLLPSDGGGAAHLNESFLPYIWIFLPLGLVLSKTRLRQIQWASSLTAIFLAACIYGGMHVGQETLRQARAVLQQLPAQSRFYPINFNVQGAGLNFVSQMHLWAVYPDEKVVFSPYLFAQSGLMPLSRIHPSSPTYFPANREGMPMSVATNSICDKISVLATKTCEELRLKKFDEILGNAVFYDYWFLYQAPEDFIARLATIPHLKRVAQNGDASLWHNEHASPFKPPISIQP